jgi:hypothetical protein
MPPTPLQVDWVILAFVSWKMPSEAGSSERQSASKGPLMLVGATTFTSCATMPVLRASAVSAVMRG